MIQANELRIGNWVDSENGKGQILSIFMDVAQMQPYRVLLSNHRSRIGIPVLSITPIRITEKILLNCGFTFDTDLYKEQGEAQFVLLKSTGRERIVYDTEVDFYKYMICDYGVDKQVGKFIKYLHQLQNLYFSLTGKELEVAL